MTEPDVEQQLSCIREIFMVAASLHGDIIEPDKRESVVDEIMRYVTPRYKRIVEESTPMGSTRWR